MILKFGMLCCVQTSEKGRIKEGINKGRNNRKSTKEKMIIQTPSLIDMAHLF